MIAEAARRFVRDLWRLLATFGIFGLVVWPTTAKLGYDLIWREVRTLEGIHVNRSTLIGRDFVNMWHGGREVRASSARDVYDREAYRDTLKQRIGIGGIYAFSYPPHMLMLAVPFGMLGYIPALLLWTLFGIGLFWFAARPWLRAAELPSWSILVLPGALINLWAGHFGFVIGGLALMGFWHTGKRPLYAGAAFALMTIKPHLGALVPILLLMKGYWRVVAAAAVGTLALIAASILTLGFQTWRMWIGSTISFQMSLVERQSRAEFIHMMPTVGRAMRQVTTDAGLISAAQYSVAMIAIVLVIWLARRVNSLRNLGLASQVATFLILPYVFVYDMVIFSLIALVAARRWPSAWYAPDKIIYGAAFLVPLMHVPLAKAGWPVSPLLIAALLALISWRMVRAKGRHAVD